MAPKRASHLEIPPAASSSEEEEKTSSEEEEETSEDEEVQATPKPSVSSLQPKNTDQSQSESDDESSSDSEPADSTVKPIASKPMEETKARSKPPSVVATPERKATSKRPRESEDSKKQAKKKKSGSEAPIDDGSGAASGDEEEEEEEEEPKKSAAAGGGGDESKKLFQRLWSEEDEIAILNGMTDYAAKKGADPAATDMNAFHDFIKKSLHIEVTKAQLSDKVRRLKKKYSNNALRNKYNPTKPHEQKMFELSKKIWGSGGGGGAGVSSSKSNSAAAAAKSNRKAVLASLAVSKEGSKKIEIDGKAMDLASSSKMIGFDMKSLSLSDHVLKKGLDLIPESKKAELEAKWKRLHIDEMELFLKKNQLISEQVKLVIEKLKSSDH